MDENIECCVKEFRNLDVDKMFLKLGCWPNIYKTWMLTESLWHLDVDRKIMGFGCWQKVCETLMLTQSWWSLDVGIELMNLWCWQKVCDTWMFTESIWNSYFDKKFKKLECWQRVYETWMLIESILTERFGACLSIKTLDGQWVYENYFRLDSFMHNRHLKRVWSNQKISVKTKILTNFLAIRLPDCHTFSIYGREHRK